MDELVVAETGMTGRYLNPDSTHTELLSKPDLPIEARKEHIFQVLAKPFCQLELFAITYDNQY